MSQGEHTDLLQQLIERQDIVSIEAGKLVIRPNKKGAVPEDWFKKHEQEIVESILKLVSKEGYFYSSFSAGNYGKNLAGGVAIQFQNYTTGNDAYTIFNANLKRKRNGKNGNKGDPLPPGHFAVGSKSNFLKFWKMTGLDAPRSLTSFHDYMGKLKGLAFNVIVGPGSRIQTSDISMISISHQEIFKAFYSLPDSTQINNGQLPDKTRIASPDNSRSETYKPWCYHHNTSTGWSNYGKTVHDDTDIQGKVIPISSNKTPQEQTTEEWLDDLGGIG